MSGQNSIDVEDFIQSEMENQRVRIAFRLDYGPGNLARACWFFQPNFVENSAGVKVS
jgi:hypothetical protein